MAQGKKYNDDIKEKAFALLACNNSIADVARTLKLPYTTIKTWRNNYLAQSEKLAEQEKNGEHSGELDLVKARQQQKEKFIGNAWRTIGKAQSMLEKKLDRAERANDPSKEPSVKELVIAIGTLYDKASLAAQEPTEIVGGEVIMKRFEDL